MHEEQGNVRTGGASVSDNELDEEDTEPLSDSEQSVNVQPAPEVAPPRSKRQQYIYCNCALVRMRVYYKQSQAGVLIGVALCLHQMKH